MASTNTIRRRCKNLADELGCDIDWLQGTTYWLQPPEDVYEGDDAREYPLNGNAFNSWEEVWEALQAYRVDIHFWRYEIDTSDTNGVLEAAEGEGRELLRAWVDDGKPALGLVLADWLQDNGHGDLADAVRAGIKKASGR